MRVFCPINIYGVLMLEKFRRLWDCALSVDVTAPGSPRFEIHRNMEFIMRNGPVSLASFAARVFSLLFLPACAALAAAEKFPDKACCRQILVVDSYSSAEQWSKNFESAFEDGMKKAGFEANMKVIELSVMRMPTVSPAEGSLERVSREVAENRPDMIVIMGLPAIEFLEPQYKRDFKDIPVIFCGYSDGMEFSESRYPQTVAIREDVDVCENIELGMRLFPDTDEIAVLTDAGPGGRAIEQAARAGLKGFKGARVRFISGVDVDTETMLRQVYSMKWNSFVVYAGWRTKKQDAIFSQNSLLRQIMLNSQGPILTPLDVESDAVLGGISISGAKSGAFAAKVAADISANGLAHAKKTYEMAGAPKFNWQVLNSYLVKASELPKGAVFYNRPPTFWAQHQLFIVSMTALVLIFAGLSLFLYARNRLLRRNGELFKRIPIRIAAFNSAGEIVFRRTVPLDEKIASISQMPEESRGVFIESISKALSGGGEVVAEYASFGSRRRGVFSKLPEDVLGKDIVLVVSMDISEEYERRMEITAKNTLLTSAAEISNMVYFVCGPDFKLRKSTGLDRPGDRFWAVENGEKVPVERWVVKADRAAFLGAWDDFTSGRSDSIDVTYRSDFYGETRYFRMRVVGRPPASGSDPVYFGVVQDITELKQNEIGLEAANKAKSYFLATMSHELRTPLNAVIGYSELLKDPSLPEGERTANIENINLSADILLRLINDILDLSKLEAGQLRMLPVPVDLYKLMDELAHVFGLAVKKRGIYLAISLQEGIPPLMLDLMRLKQVLLNVVGNAVKFTGSGGIDVGVSFEPRADGAAGLLKISVKDTGEGISDDLIGHIFDPFRQSDGSVRGGHIYEGTGLGLAISQKLANHMGGSISVRSKKGEGSVFTIALEGVAVAEAPEVRASAAPSAAPAPASFSGTAVIVDDVPMNLKILGAVLKKMGVGSVPCNSADEALAALEQSLPDIVMTDLWMPQKSGADLAAELRKNPRTSKIPVVLITADAEMEGLDRTLFDAIVIKPITMEKLGEALRAAGLGTH